MFLIITRKNYKQLLFENSMSNDKDRYPEFFPELGKTVERIFNVSLVKTNQRILDECKSHIVTNPPAKNSKPYELLLLNNSTNSPVSEKVDLIYIRQQDAQWHDIFLYLRGFPTLLMLQSSEENSNAQLKVISKSKQPDFDDGGIPQWLSTIGIQ